MVRCPQCKQLILPENRDTRTGQAKCPECNISVPYTYQTEVNIDRNTVQDPPPGIVVIDRIDRIIIRYRQHADSVIDAIVPGLLGCAVAGSLCYFMLSENEFPLRLLAMTVTGLVGLFCILSVLYGLFGKMQITDDGEMLILSSGIGPIGRTWYLRPNDIQKVELIQEVTASGQDESDQETSEITYHIAISCRENRTVKCFYNANTGAVRYFCAYLRHKARLL